jgi:hypothetical protein
MSRWRSGLVEAKPTAPTPRRRHANQISESASASGKRSPFNTSATRPGFTRKPAAMLWMASPRRRRFPISIASARVSDGDVGADRGICGRRFSGNGPPYCCSELVSVRVTDDENGGFGSEVIDDIDSPFRQKAACQTRWTGYVNRATVESRAAIAAVIQLGRAALPGAALCVWLDYSGMASIRWLGGHIEAELWKAKHDGIRCLPPNQFPSDENPRRPTA